MNQKDQPDKEFPYQMSRVAPLQIVSLERFFSNNHYPESIVGDENVKYQPEELFSILLELRGIDGIEDVMVELKDNHPSKRWPVADTFWVIAERDVRFYQNFWPKKFWDSLPSDYLSYPRKDGRLIEPVPIPVGMIAIGMQYYVHHKDRA